MKAFLVNGVFMFAALAPLTSIFIGISDAQVSAVASFNDPRCVGEMVCPNDPLLFTCTVTESTATLAEVTLPSGEAVQVTSTNMTEQVGATPLPNGVTVQSHNAIVDGGLVDYTLTLAINRASLLRGNPVICDARTLSPSTDEQSCPVATDPPGPPVGLSQNVSANTEMSAVVQWESPAMTGGSGVTISEYRVTGGSGMNQTVSHDDSRDVFTATITVPQFNTSYSVSVTAINSCGLSSQPATTTVFIEARLPPQPQSVSLSMECSVRNVRSVNISWMDGMREVGIVYPGEKELVVLTPGNIDCTVDGSTRCTASISDDDNYTLNLTLSNDIGSSEPVIDSFNSMALLREDNLDGDEPSVTVTVNENCSNAYSYQVSVSFGVREEGSTGNCDFQDVVTETLMPMVSETFQVNETKVPLMVDQEYCFNVSLQETTIAPSTEPPTEPKPLPPGAIAGIAIGVGAFVIGVVIGFIIGFIVYRNKRNVPQSDQEMKHLSSSASDPGSPVAKDTAAISRETGEVLYTEVDPNRTTEQVQPGLVYQDPTTIEHHEGPSGDLYAMPLTSGKKGKKEKKGKGKEEEAEQQELTEEEKAAMYSVPDKKGQKAKSQGLTYADIDIQRSTKPAPPSQGSYYADIKL